MSELEIWLPLKKTLASDPTLPCTAAVLRDDKRGGEAEGMEGRKDETRKGRRGRKGRKGGTEGVGVGKKLCT